LWRQSE